LSKGLTGGFLPLSLTVSTESIYETFLSDDWKKAFIHGHSYTANPIACAAALKAQELLQTPTIQKNIKRIFQLHTELLAELPGELICERRHLGTIAAVDLASPALADAVKLELFAKGVVVRPLGSTVYFIPPYCISEQNLRYAYQCLKDFLKNPRHSTT
jgi:adenosylmethionine-8-amino-7-oxononanoate aminotransferase